MPAQPIGQCQRNGFGPDVFASFETWCSLANLNPGAARKRAKESMEAEHPERTGGRETIQTATFPLR
jgi:hypothetical protein